MDNSWVWTLDERELLALIPKAAVGAVDKPDKAIRLIAREMIGRGLISSEGVRTAKTFRAIKLKAMKKPNYPDRPIPRADFWESVKREFRLLVCTDSKKYALVRRSLNKHGSGATLMMVILIASSIGLATGIGAGICMPIVSVLLLAAMSVGPNAFCLTLAE